ncbi:MAG: hypothetical protein ACKODY_10370 [Actinomycetota bacterium]
MAHTSPTPNQLERFAALCHKCYLRAATEHESCRHIFNVLLPPDADLGPLELLELCPTTRIIAKTHEGRFLTMPFAESPWIQFPFSTFAEPAEAISEMKLPEEAVAFCVSFESSMIFKPILNRVSGTEAELKPTKVRQTVVVARDGRTSSLLTPEGKSTVKAADIWGGTINEMKDAFSRVAV